jgi:hypothetical protein
MANSSGSPVYSIDNRNSGYWKYSGMGIARGSVFANDEIYCENTLHRKIFEIGHESPGFLRK